MENKIKEDPPKNKKKFKKTIISLIFMGVFSIVYFPLFFYIDGVILEMKTKKAIEKFMKENCQTDLIVTGFNFTNSWGSKTWTAITTPEFNDIRGFSRKGIVDFLSPNSCGSGRFTLDRNTSQFIPVSLFKSPLRDFRVDVSINYFFGVLIVLIALFMVSLYFEISERYE